MNRQMILHSFIFTLLLLKHQTQQVKFVSYISEECSPVRCLLFCQYGFTKDENGCDICMCRDPYEVCEVSTGRMSILPSSIWQPIQNPNPWKLFSDCRKSAVTASVKLLKIEHLRNQKPLFFHSCRLQSAREEIVLHLPRVHGAWTAARRTEYVILTCPEATRATTVYPQVSTFHTVSGSLLHRVSNDRRLHSYYVIL